MGRKIGSGPCRRTHRSPGAGDCFRSLWGRGAGGIGRRAAPETLRSRPAGYISDGEPSPRGAQFMRMSQSALSRNAKAECVPDSAQWIACARGGTACVDIRGPGPASSRGMPGTVA